MLADFVIMKLILIFTLSVILVVESKTLSRNRRDSMDWDMFKDIVEDFDDDDDFFHPDLKIDIDINDDFGEPEITGVHKDKQHKNKTKHASCQRGDTQLVRNDTWVVSDFGSGMTGAILAKSSCFGRLEVCDDKQWWSHCGPDHGWSANAEKVACKAAGCGLPLKTWQEPMKTANEKESPDQHMAHLRCDGDEDHLFECGTQDCAGSWAPPAKCGAHCGNDYKVVLNCNPP